MNYVEIHNVSKTVKKKVLLNDINFSLEKGHIAGIIGRNGSGKTVLLKCICGLMQPDEGIIMVNDKEIGVDCEHPDSMGVIIEAPGFLPYHSGYKNLEFLASLNNKITKQEVMDIMNKVGLSGEEKKLVAKYSLGMKQRLGIAQAIMENPDFLILDEPMNGLDKSGVEDIRNILLELKKKGRTIILTSHNSEDIDVLCDNVWEMDKGLIVNKCK